MNRKWVVLFWTAGISVACCGQSAEVSRELPDAPFQRSVSFRADKLLPRLTQSAPGRQVPAGVTRLKVKDAEAIALRNNPAISAARLSALVSQQITREVRSSLWPQTYTSLTGVDARENSRITAGFLNNPSVYKRAAGGAVLSQLITDFGRTTNLVASARLQEKADDESAMASIQDILIAVDQAFYNALDTHDVLRVAEKTVAARQLVSDEISALTESKLRSELDLSFANVNLAQAKLLYLDSLNNDKAAMASLSAILGFESLQNFELVADTEPLTAPPADVDPLIALAFSMRPEILSLEFASESAEKLHLANRDLMLPVISALAAYGDSPVRDPRLFGPYGAVGVNIQIPVFNGFLFPAKAREADLRAQAVRKRLMDMRDRISRDVRTSWLAATTAFDRVTVSEQLLAHANEALDLAQLRYKLGLSSIVELSQAELQQTQAEIGNTEAGYQYRLALAVLRYQTTGL
jgi:outer membrane protein